MKSRSTRSIVVLAIALVVVVTVWLVRHDDGRSSQETATTGSDLTTDTALVAPPTVSRRNGVHSTAVDDALGVQSQADQDTAETPVGKSSRKPPRTRRKRATDGQQLDEPETPGMKGGEPKVELHKAH